MDVTDLLARAVDAGASDLHLAAGQLPMLRLDGELQRLPEERMVIDDQEPDRHSVRPCCMPMSSPLQAVPEVIIASKNKQNPV